MAHSSFLKRNYLQFIAFHHYTGIHFLRIFQNEIEVLRLQLTSKFLEIVQNHNDIYHWQIQGGARDARPPLQVPNSLIFMQFSATNLQNNKLAHPLLELVPFWEILGPPLFIYCLSICVTSSFSKTITCSVQVILTSVYHQ